MAKLALSSVANLLDTTTSQTTINTNNDLIETALENTLSRDGISPNSMSSTLDMDSNQIINLPVPISGSSPLRLSDLSGFTGGGTVTNIPVGGTFTQGLSKLSDTDYDIGWRSYLSSVSSTGASLTLSTVSANTDISINLAHANTWTGQQTFVAPVLGTPASGVLTNTTGLPIGTGVSGLAAGIATFLATPTSANLATAITNETGTGSLVFATSPTFVTPVLGAATATSINGNTLTTGTYTLTGSAGKTLTFSNTLTLAGTDASTLNIGAGGTLGTNAYTSTAYAPLASPTFTGTVTHPSPFTLGSTSVTTTGTQLNYLSAAAGTTGTASTNVVFSTSPTLVTPALGTPTAVVLTNATGLPVSTGVSGFGTGIAAALAINTGSAGAPVLFNGAGGTPTSIALTNATSFPSTVSLTANRKIITFTRAYSAASGNVSYTGVGFTPTSLHARSCNPIGQIWWSNGSSDASLASTSLFIYGTASASLQSNLIRGDDDATGANYQTATVVSYDADGFTLAWTKTGTPVSGGSLNCSVIAIR